jgi:hypothetical protein
MGVNVKLGFILVAAASILSFDTAGAADVTVLAVGGVRTAVNINTKTTHKMSRLRFTEALVGGPLRSAVCDIAHS